MDPTASPTIALAERRLHWLDARQRVLARNIANADTPGFRPADLPDFAKVLGGQAASLSMLRADPRHLAGRGGDARARADRAAEASPNGNAVSLEREAMRVADTDTAHALALGLHRRWLGMFKTALGRGQ